MYRYGLAAGSPERFSSRVARSPGPPTTRIIAPLLSSPQTIRSGASDIGR